MQPLLQIRKLHPQASIPQYQSQLAAGLDVATCLPDGDLVLSPGDIALVKTGISMAIPPGYEAQIRPRSGLATRHGITLPNTPGTIDADYRGELMVPLINLGREPFAITHGMRIAQMVIAPVARAAVVVVETLSATQRGEGGFGSTGVAESARQS